MHALSLLISIHRDKTASPVGVFQYIIVPARIRLSVSIMPTTVYNGLFFPDIAWEYADVAIVFGLSVLGITKKK